MSVLEKRHSSKDSPEGSFSTVLRRQIALPRQVQFCCGSLDDVPHVQGVSRTQHSAHLQLSDEKNSQVDYDVKRQGFPRNGCHGFLRLLNTMWMCSGVHVTGMLIAAGLAHRSQTSFTASNVSWRVAEHLRHNDRKLTRLGDVGAKNTLQLTRFTAIEQVLFPYSVRA